MLHFVKNINKVEPYKLTLLFNTGETKTIDLSQKLKEWAISSDSKFRDLLNPEYFLSVKLNKALETICWENGIDFCPDTLYSWAD